jgi:hypothetical protein
MSGTLHANLSQPRFSSVMQYRNGKYIGIGDTLLRAKNPQGVSTAMPPKLANSHNTTTEPIRKFVVTSDPTAQSHNELGRRPPNSPSDAEGAVCTISSLAAEAVCMD